MTLSEQYIAFSTIVVKEFMRFIRIWVQTVLPAMITMGLYFVIFGNLIGSQLAPIQGFNYVDYIVPGIILMAMINNSYANVVSSFFSAKFQRHIEEMLVSPMPNYLIDYYFYFHSLRLSYMNFGLQYNYLFFHILSLHKNLSGIDMN